MPIINLVYEVPSWPSLKSYEEIVAMATSEWYPRTNTLAELNRSSDIGLEYYLTFLNSWQMSMTQFQYSSYYTINWIHYWTVWTDAYYIARAGSWQTWQEWHPSEPD